MKLSIVFDLDGTLITCENKQKNVLLSILKSYGYKNPDFLNDWWELKRNGYTTEKALIELGIPSSQLISQDWKRIIEDFPWCSLDMPFSDSIATLELLKERNYRIYIVTARKSRLQLMQTIYRIGFDRLVDDIFIVNPQNTIKEKAEILIKLKPELFIGDTESDFDASSNSGSKFVALSRGQRSAMFLKKYGILDIQDDLKFLQIS